MQGRMPVESSGCQNVLEVTTVERRTCRMQMKLSAHFSFC